VCVCVCVCAVFVNSKAARHTVKIGHERSDLSFTLLAGSHADRWEGGRAETSARVVTRVGGKVDEQRRVR
jgi:hypothetical protein